MKNLTVQVAAAKPVVDAPAENVRFVTDPVYGTTKEILSTKSKCCICNQYFWVQDKGVTDWLHEAFKVMDPRAYVGGLPDYLKISHVLLDVHYTCKDEMNTRLNNGEYLQVVETENIL